MPADTKTPLARRADPAQSPLTPRPEVAAPRSPPSLAMPAPQALAGSPAQAVAPQASAPRGPTTTREVSASDNKRMVEGVMRVDKNLAQRLTETMPLYRLDGSVLREGTDRILDALLADHDILEVHFNGAPTPVFVLHRQYGICVTNANLRDDRVTQFVLRTATANGVEIGERYVADMRVHGMYRIHAVLPPVSGPHPTFVIRQAVPELLSMPMLIANGTVSVEAAAYLWAMADGIGGTPANIMVVGRPQSGRTTLLNAMLRMVPLNARIATVENLPELRLVHPNHIQLRAGHGKDMIKLVTNALRQRPDRIVVGDIQGPEANALITAMGTGHPGSMGVLCAKDAQAAVDELALPPSSIDRKRLGVINVMIVTDRVGVVRGSKRIVSGIYEVEEGGDTGIRMHPIYLYDLADQVVKPTGNYSYMLRQISSEKTRSKEEMDEIMQRRQATLIDLANRRAGLGALLQAVVNEARLSQ